MLGRRLEVSIFSDLIPIWHMKLVTQLDQKVSDQQVTLERAGVPGFFVTNNPTEIQVQMYLLEFIVKIGNRDV